MNVTRDTAKRAIEKVAAVYQLPNRRTAEDVAKVWADVMADVDSAVLDDAVDAFLRENETGFFPKPGAIRTLCLRIQHQQGHRYGRGDLASQYRAWEQHHADGRCPVCHSGLRLIKAAERGLDPSRPDRYGVWHDVDAHRRAGVPHVGFPCETLKPEPRQHREAA